MTQDTAATATDSTPAPAQAQTPTPSGFPETMAKIRHHRRAFTRQLIGDVIDGLSDHAEIARRCGECGITIGDLELLVETYQKRASAVAAIEAAGRLIEERGKLIDQADVLAEKKAQIIAKSTELIRPLEDERSALLTRANDTYREASSMRQNAEATLRSTLDAEIEQRAQAIGRRKDQAEWALKATDEEITKLERTQTQIAEWKRGKSQVGDIVCPPWHLRAGEIGPWMRMDARELAHADKALAVTEATLKAKRAESERLQSELAEVKQALAEANKLKLDPLSFALP